MKKNKKGFTLVELLAVIALVAILSGLAVTNVVSSIDNSRKNSFLMDSKRMVSKAEYLLSQSRDNRDQAKASGIIFDYNKLNEKGEFPSDADGRKFDPSSFVKVTYNNSTKQYNYCICVMGSKRKVGSNCDSTAGKGCVSSDTLTNVSAVYDLNAVVEIEEDDDSGNGGSGTTETNALKLGDYFTLVPDVATYTVSSSVTGYSSDQTINIAGTSASNGLRLWRVIDVHKDGSVDAVSEYVSKDVVYFKGATGYQYYVSTLQLIASQFAKSGYTIGTRMMGYGGQTGVIPTKSNPCTGTCQSTTTYAFDGSTNDAPPDIFVTGEPEEYLGGVGGDTLYLKDNIKVGYVYKKDTTTYGTTGLKAYKVGTTNYTEYWIASRLFNCSFASYFTFSARLMSTSGSLSDGQLRFFSSDDWGDEYYGSSIRPIITLKSGITTSGGKGTKDSPYTLGASLPDNNNGDEIIEAVIEFEDEWVSVEATY